MAILIRKQLVYGVRPILPLKGFPCGKYRLRMRPEDCAVLYVKTADGIRCYTIKEEDGHWVPDMECGVNQRGVI